MSSILNQKSCNHLLLFLFVCSILPVISVSSEISGQNGIGDQSQGEEHDKQTDQMLALLNDKVKLFNVALSSYIRSLGANEELQVLLDRVGTIKTFMDNETIRHSLRLINILENNKSLKQLLREIQDMNSQVAFEETANGRFWKRIIAEYSSIYDQLKIIHNVLEHNQKNYCGKLAIVSKPLKQFNLMKDISKEFFDLIGRFSGSSLSLLRQEESIEPINELASQIQATLKRWPHVALLGNSVNDANCSKFIHLMEQYLGTSITEKSFHLKLSTFSEKYKNLARNIVYWFEKDNAATDSQLQQHLARAQPDLKPRPCPYQAI